MRYKLNSLFLGVPNKHVLAEALRRNPPPELHIVSLSPYPTNGGTTIGSGSYYHGDMIEIDAIANPEFTFSEWDDGNANHKRTIQILGDTNLTAYFKRDFGIAEFEPQY